MIYYCYNAFDRLVARWHDTDYGQAGIEEQEYYVYDSAPGKGGLDDVVLTFDQNDSVLHRYLHGPAIDQIFSDESMVDGLLWALSAGKAPSGTGPATTRRAIRRASTTTSSLTASGRSPARPTPTTK